MPVCDLGHLRSAGPPVRGPDDAASLVKLLVCDEHHQGQLIIGIDHSGRARDAELRCPCDVCHDPMITTAKQLMSIGVGFRCCSLLLVTFVTDGRLAPSTADIARFEGLEVECSKYELVLADHLLMSGHRWRSIREASIRE